MCTIPPSLLFLIVEFEERRLLEGRENDEIVVVAAAAAAVNQEVQRPAQCGDNKEIMVQKEPLASTPQVDGESNQRDRL